MIKFTERSLSVSYAEQIRKEGTKMFVIINGERIVADLTWFRSRKDKLSIFTFEIVEIG